MHYGKDVDGSGQASTKAYLSTASLLCNSFVEFYKVI
jgi:hypothetical protein